MTVRVFFDIDATLLLTDGAGRAALKAALETVYGTSGRLDGYSFHGKTDPQIVVELLSGVGHDVSAIRERMPSMWPVYLEVLKRELDVRRAADRITLLPGVAELLAALENRDGVSLGILTGNIEEAAKLKLEAAGVTTEFDFAAYGSDSEQRTEVARIALERSRSRSGEEPNSLMLVVVGDTPDDVACARAIDARAVAVATGRHGVAELEAAGADFVFSDFSDTQAVLSSILSPSPAAGRPGGATGSGGAR